MTRRTAMQLLAALACAPLASLLTGCYGIPKGTMKQVPMGKMKLEAKGAGIVGVTGDKTTFQIRCEVCGYTEEPASIDTPKFGEPHVQRYTCPKCAHQQWVTIQQVPR